MPRGTRRVSQWLLSLPTRLSPLRRMKAKRSRSARPCTRWPRPTRRLPTSRGSRHFLIVSPPCAQLCAPFYFSAFLDTLLLRYMVEDTDSRGGEGEGIYSTYL